MTINTYFQSGLNIGETSEQDLVEDLIIETIQIKGFEVQYLPRSTFNQDKILGEDPLSTFNNAFPVEVYLDNVNGWDGELDLMTKFGVEVREGATFTIARKRWREATDAANSFVAGNLQLLNRPAEGDCLYFPLTNSIFEIRRVELDDPFYQLSKTYVFKLECELIQYSSERFQTGNAAIDDLTQVYAQNIESYYVLDETTGEALAFEYEGVGVEWLDEGYSPDSIDANAMNDAFAEELDDVVDFSESNPFGDLRG